jgi:very-short-patch-repair endonuclease
MAAALACGPKAVLSHGSAGSLWMIVSATNQIEISVPGDARPRRPGIIIHRRTALTPQDVTKHEGIPVTTPICTLIDLATRLDRPALERAINEADKHRLVTPDRVRAAAERLAGRPGARAVRELLDAHAFVLTDSDLEQFFVPIARRAGLPRARTRSTVNGFKVDFYWPDLGLVVETDGLRYHRTPSEQASDRVRDQTHAAAGMTPLRSRTGRSGSPPTACALRSPRSGDDSVAHLPSNYRIA